MLRRTPFRRPDPPPSHARVKEWDGPRPTARATVIARIVSAFHAPVPKKNALRSATYRRWVASLPCAVCRLAGPSQCAHSDVGKGLAVKATDATCYPLCADQPGRLGCHSRIGASGVLGRDWRRAAEARYSTETARLARATGNWPEGWT